MSAQARTTNAWRDDGGYKIIYVRPDVHAQIKVSAAQRGTTIPEEIARLVAADQARTVRGAHTGETSC